MKFVLAILLALAALPASAADLSDIDTFLGEKSFDEVQDVSVRDFGSHRVHDDLVR